MNLSITVTKSSKSNLLKQRIKALQKRAVYVGIPEGASNSRNALLSSLADKEKKKSKLVKEATSDINNATLLFIHTHGSELQGIPPRPVIEPAIAASGNKEKITSELAGAAKAVLEGTPGLVAQGLERAGLTAQNASRNWFTDPRNGWAPNAPSTIQRKGSDRPLIDTGALRNSITYVVKDDE